MEEEKTRKKEPQSNQLTLEAVSKIVLRDVFAIVKRLISPDEAFEIRINNYEIQEIFSTLLSRISFPNLSQILVFSSSGPIPYGPLLEGALERLSLSNLATRPYSGDPDVLVLTRGLDTVFENYLRRQDERECFSTPEFRERCELAKCFLAWLLATGKLQ